MTLFDVMLSVVSLALVCTGAISAFEQVEMGRQRQAAIIAATNCVRNAAESIMAGRPATNDAARVCRVSVDSSRKGWLKVEADVQQTHEVLWLVGES